MANKYPDGRHFMNTIGITEYSWMSRKHYKTEKGARSFLYKLNRTNAQEYLVVESSEYSYRVVKGLPVVYRVAVR